MDKNLISLLTKGSKLVNLYTGHVYRYIEQEGNSNYIKAILQGEEKWNKYKLIYEEVPAKEVRVDITELVAADIIPFISNKGKTLFTVYNLDIISYKKEKDIIPARVVLLEQAMEDENILFTLVDKAGNDISDTGRGYTVAEFSKIYNKKNKAVKKISIEDGIFAEVDKRFNIEENNADIVKTIKKSNDVDTYKPLNLQGLHNRLKKLGFLYKDELAYKRLSLLEKLKKETSFAVTTDMISSLVGSGFEGNKVDGTIYLEVYNIARQIREYGIRNGYEDEMLIMRDKATIDVTDEEKAYTQANIDRLENLIKECDIRIEELEAYRKSLINEHNNKAITCEYSEIEDVSSAEGVA